MSEQNGTENIDALYESITSTPSPERPMSSPAPTPTPPAAPFELSFKARGEERKVTDVEQAKQLLSKGFDYSELVSELKKDQESIKSYKEVDEYAKQNPQWWEAVQKAYEAKDKPVAPTVDNNPILQELLDFKHSVLRQQQLDKEAKENENLDKEIKEVKEQFKQINFSKADGNGQTLESRILKHASEKGISNFKAAAKDYLFDDLMKLAEERGKETVGKVLEERSKLGLLGVSQAPIKEIASPVNLKSKSYEDLYKEAIEELKLDK